MQSPVPFSYTEYLATRPVSGVLRQALAGLGGSVVDIGAGPGRVIQHLLTQDEQRKIIAVDSDPQLAALIGQRFPSVRVVQADALEPLCIAEMQAAVAVNSCHEICSGGSLNERLAKFAGLVNNISNMLAEGGEVLIYDGFMPENEHAAVTLLPRSPKAEQDFVRFVEEYEGQRVAFSRDGNESFTMSLEDLIIFVTKFSYLDNPSLWETERRELYPFLPVEKACAALRAGRFDIVSITHPNTGTGVVEFMNRYKIPQYSVASFPHIQFLIKAKKQ